MWGARGSFPPAAAMVVMVAVGSWSLASTVGIVYVFYGINLFFGINIYAGIKSIRPVRTGPIKLILFINIPGLFSVYSGINRENKFYSNNGSHPVGDCIYSSKLVYSAFMPVLTTVRFFFFLLAEDVHIW
jgi:hypothetical protein